MIPYCDYDFYKETYKGIKVPETEFYNLSLKASMKIKNRTFGRSNNISKYCKELLKLCTCFLVDRDYEYIIKNLKNQGKKSESVGSWSVSFETSNVLKDTYDRDIEQIMQENLSEAFDKNFVPLLYRGVDYV